MSFMRSKILRYAIPAIAVVALGAIGWLLTGGSESRIGDDRPAANTASTEKALPQGASEAASKKADEPQTPTPSDIPLQRHVAFANPQYPKAFTVDEQTPKPDGPVAPLIASLWEKADQGDAYAGYKIFLAISRCVEVMRKRNSGDAPPSGAEVDLKDCEGVTAADIERSYRVLRRSAEQGDIEALLLYPLMGAEQFKDMTDALRRPQDLQQYREDSMRFLERAAHMGSIDAIGELASTYKNGIMTDPDPVLAYAYQYAKKLLTPHTSADLEAVLNLYATGLTEQQIQAGQKKAYEIVSRCCLQGGKP